MPEFFKTWLEGLTNAEKNRMWDYFDGEPLAVEAIINIVGQEDGQPWPEA